MIWTISPKDQIRETSQLGAVSKEPKGFCFRHIHNERCTSWNFAFRSKALEYEMHIWDAHPSHSFSLLVGLQQDSLNDRPHAAVRADRPRARVLLHADSKTHVICLVGMCAEPLYRRDLSLV